MSNLLHVAMIETILSLRQRGWSKRRIARELGIDRETVARHLRQLPAPAKPAIAPIGSPDTGAGSKPANAPIGSDGADDVAKPANALIGSDGAVRSAEVAPPAEEHQAAGRSSDCEPWRAVI